MKYYYAVSWTFGIGVCHELGDGRKIPLRTVYRFKSSDLRDSWVHDFTFSPLWGRREAVSASEIQVDLRLSEKTLCSSQRWTFEEKGEREGLSMLIK
jgi:hypothetical protein